MDQNIRFCTQRGHQQCQVYHICTYSQCDLNRWCCTKCLDDGIHEHQKPNSSHIINQEEFSARVKSDIETLQNAKDYQEINKNKNKYLKSRKYTIKQIDDSPQNFIESSIISNNEQFLVYNNEDVLHIYNIKLNKICKSFVLDEKLSSFQFTIDSLYLFAGDYNGSVYGFIVQKDFKMFYKQQIHQYAITKIISQKQYLITSSCDESIVKTDFITKKQIFKLVGHSNWIMSIDYDHQKDIIISVSVDRYIKIWDCKSESISIDYVHDNMLYQVQFINNNSHILALDNRGNLMKFKIDHQNKQLVKVNQYYDENRIIGFQQVNSDQNLLLICSQYCKILNNQGELINIIQHNLQLSCINLFILQHI